MVKNRFSVHEIIKEIKPSTEEFQVIHKEARNLSGRITKEIKKARIKAEVFVAGSLAKDTLIRKDRYDIDIFVRFDKSYADNELSNILEKVLSRVVKNLRKAGLKEISHERVHGSRDYFQITYKHKEIKKALLLEIVPVVKIRTAGEARNVTDLSYFHINYILKKTRKSRRLSDEIRLAKAFCYAQNCYGAETYIKGFSGYALEVLVSYYGSFMKLLRAASGWRIKEKIVIDPEKHYSSREDVLVNMNEAKLQSPLVVVDPTYKLRNITAALSRETLARFVKAARKFISHPKKDYFKSSKVDGKSLKLAAKRRKAGFALIQASSRIKGERAAAKLSKLHDFLIYLLKREGFKLMRVEREFSSEKKISIFLVYKNPDKNLIIKGPPARLKEHAERFKKKYRKAFIKNSRYYARLRRERGIKDILNELRKGNEMKNMQIKSLNLKA